MASNKTIKYIIGIAVAAVLPLSLYFIMRSMSDGKIKLPAYYRIDRIDSSMNAGGDKIYDTSFHRVHDVTLINQLGKTVNLNQDLKGKALVINFIFTSCPTVCPNLTRSMNTVQKAFIKKNPDMVQFISISVDPARDSVKALRAFADRFGADHDRWWFLTGNSDSIFGYARNELGLTLQPAEANDGAFDHSVQFVLLDSARYIRGYYNGLDPQATKKLADDIIILSMEKKKKDKKH